MAQSDLLTPEQIGNIIAEGTPDACFQEAMARSQEKDAEILEKYYINDQADLANADARAGHRMHHSEFMLKVQHLNPEIFIEQQINFPDDLGFYTLDVAGVKRYLSSFPKGYIREFSYVVLDKQGLPCDEVRGWRTTLWRLLRVGMLSWPDVHRVFGEAQGAHRDRWLQMTFPFRARELKTLAPI